MPDRKILEGSGLLPFYIPWDMASHGKQVVAGLGRSLQEMGKAPGSAPTTQQLLWMLLSVDLSRPHGWVSSLDAHKLLQMFTFLVILDAFELTASTSHYKGKYYIFNYMFKSKTLGKIY